jgi:hypothetical protein
MNIEFHAPEGQVKEWILRYIRVNLLDFYHAYKKISRAEVYFREEPYEDHNDKVCEISLAIFGDAFFAHERALSYEQAAQNVLSVLREKIEELKRTEQEVPEKIFTTVEI